MINMTAWKIITEWNYPYESFLNWIKETKNELTLFPEKKFLLICSHPHCFTIGRGLRETNDGPKLTQFDPTLKQSLPFPLYEINRGGGLTFHYPGQLIVYPMVNLNFFRKSLMVLSHKLLLSMGETLKELDYFQSYSIPKEAYGLWSAHKKIASVGMGMEKFITEHGLATNIYNDSDMFNALKNLFPCGMNASIYDTIENFAIDKNFSMNSRNIIKDIFIEKFFASIK